jgi:hypothetical protein
MQFAYRENLYKNMRSFLLAMLCLCVGFSQAAVVNVTPGVIEADETWSATNIYMMTDFTAIAPGVTLTIEEGTVVMGSGNATLLVLRGATLNAQGSASAPIVFTSSEAPGSRGAGDWGGIIILGDAPINVPGGVTTIEGGVPNELSGQFSSSTYSGVNEYGGSNPSDNSGVLSYVRIEYAGVPFSLDNEINSLTCGGVGSGTKIEYVMSTEGNDDQFEFFGGTVNTRYLVANGGIDDVFDTDFGYSGVLQFAIVRRNPMQADFAGSSNGFESDNDGSGSTNSPRTAMTAVNITLLGPIQFDGDDSYAEPYRRGAHIRRSSNTSIYNSIVAGWPLGVRVDGGNSSADYESGSLQLRNNIWAGNEDSYDCTDCTGDINTQAGAEGNMTYSALLDADLVDPYNWTSTPDFHPNAGSIATTMDDYDGLPFSAGVLEDVEYIGALDVNDTWADGWTEWYPQNIDYIALVAAPEVVALNAMDLYPNPATDLVRIKLDFEQAGNYSVELINLQGQTMWATQMQMSAGTQIVPVQTADFAAGQYLVRLSDGRASETMPLILQ